MTKLQCSTTLEAGAYLCRVLVVVATDLLVEDAVLLVDVRDIASILVEALSVKLALAVNAE